MRTWVRDRHRILGPVLVGCGLLLVPWLLYLSFKLPNTARARNWSLMWTGVDVAEAVGLILTGVLQWRRSPRRALPAAFTSALLAIDAWVDVTTSAPGHAKLVSALMAGLVEVPAAVACLLLAVSTFPVAGWVPTDVPPGLSTAPGPPAPLPAAPAAPVVDKPPAQQTGTPATPIPSPANTRMMAASD